MIKPSTKELGTKQVHNYTTCELKELLYLLVQSKVWNILVDNLQ